MKRAKIETTTSGAGEKSKLPLVSLTLSMCLVFSAFSLLLGQIRHLDRLKEAQILSAIIAKNYQFRGLPPPPEQEITAPISPVPVQNVIQLLGTSGGATDFLRQATPAEIAASQLQAKLEETPEYLHLNHVRLLAALDVRFAPLFDKLNIDVTRQRQLRNLLAERENLGDDVNAGINATADLVAGGSKVATDIAGEAMSVGNTQIERDIAQLLGTDGYAAYQNYTANMSQYLLVAELNQSLAQVGGSLSEEQKNALAALLIKEKSSATRIQNSLIPIPQDEQGPLSIFGYKATAIAANDAYIGQSGDIFSTANINSEAAGQAAKILSGTQLAAFLKIQENMTISREMAVMGSVN